MAKAKRQSRVGDRCRKNYLGGVSIGALLVLGLSHPANAQEMTSLDSADESLPDNQDEAGPQSAEASQGDSAFQSNEIIVTARRREEIASRVPVSVVAISGDSLRENNIVRLPDIERIEPGITLSVGTIFPYAYIRGFGSGGDLSLEQTIGKFVDNVSYGRDQDILIPLYDIEQVEVLKGPQVLLYGNSATAGAVVISNKKPEQVFEGYLSASYEFSYDETQLEGALNVPFGDAAALRVAGFVQDRNKGAEYNPYLDETQPTYENWGIRPTLRIWPDDDITIDLRFEYDDVKTRGGTLQQITQPLSPASRPFPFLEEGVRGYNEGVAPFFTFDSSGIENTLYQLDINWDAMGGTFTSTTAYRDLTAFSVLTLTTEDPFFLTSAYQEYSQFSQEFRYTGTIGAFDVTAGIYYEEYDHDTGQSAGFNLAGRLPVGASAPPAFGRITLAEIHAESWSPFADVSFDIVENLTLSLGARYSFIDKTGGKNDFASGPPVAIDFDTGFDGLTALADPTLTTLVQNILGSDLFLFPFGSLTYSDEYLQPQAILQYQYDPEHMVFGKVVEGYKAGGFNLAYSGSDPDQVPFLSEKALSYEAGLKGRFLDLGLDYSLIFYNITFSDLQTSAFSGVEKVLSNVGEARSRGAELSLDYTPVTGLRLSLDVEYLDAEYIDFKNGTCTSVQLLENPQDCRQDLSGTPTRFSSDWSGSFGVNYGWSVGDFDVEVAANAYGRSKYNLGSPRDSDQFQDGYVQLGGFVQVSPQDDRWSLQIFGNNLTDKRVFTFTGTTPFNGTSDLASFSDGLTVGARVSINFD